MKKIFLVALVLITISSCEESKYNKMHKELVKSYCSSEDVDTTGLIASTFKYQGHDFIRFFSTKNENIVHHPECKKCITLFD